MTLLAKWDFPDMAFTLYFLNFVDDPASLPSDPAARALAMMGMPGCVELTHNYGTESDAAFAGYASGNTEPCKGFGHIGITVNDVAAACARFAALGVEFVKRPDAGKMRNLAFIKDPDG
jgi:lactoylglutathione lyase